MRGVRNRPQQKCKLSGGAENKKVILEAVTAGLGVIRYLQSHCSLRHHAAPCHQDPHHQPPRHRQVGCLYPSLSRLNLGFSTAQPPVRLRAAVALTTVRSRQPEQRGPAAAVGGAEQRAGRPGTARLSSQSRGRGPAGQLILPLAARGAGGAGVR